MHAKRVVGVALAGVLTIPALAIGEAPDAHAHDHDGHGAAGATLRLNDGKKWETDASLRAGMQAIRDELAPAIDAIHHGKYTSAQFDALGAKLEKHLLEIMANCKLPPDADAQLHILLVDFFAGAKSMKAGDERKQGAVKILRSLESYASHFEHPDWKPIVH